MVPLSIANVKIETRFKRALKTVDDVLSFWVDVRNRGE